MRAIKRLASDWLVKADGLRRVAESRSGKNIEFLSEDSEDEGEIQNMLTLADTIKTCAVQLLTAIKRDAANDL